MACEFAADFLGGRAHRRGGLVEALGRFLEGLLHLGDHGLLRLAQQLVGALRSSKCCRRAADIGKACSHVGAGLAAQGVGDGVRIGVDRFGEGAREVVFITLVTLPVVSDRAVDTRSAVLLSVSLIWLSAPDSTDCSRSSAPEKTLSNLSRRPARALSSLSSFLARALVSSELGVGFPNRSATLARRIGERIVRLLVASSPRRSSYLACRFHPTSCWSVRAAVRHDGRDLSARVVQRTAGELEVAFVYERLGNWLVVSAKATRPASSDIVFAMTLDTWPVVSVGNIAERQVAQLPLLLSTELKVETGASLHRRLARR